MKVEFEGENDWEIEKKVRAHLEKQYAHVLTCHDVNDLLRTAQQVITKDYFDDVNGVIETLKDLVYEGYIHDDDSFIEHLHEAIDGHSRVIHTREAMWGLLASDNAEAGLEEGVVEVNCRTGMPWSQLMYCAMERDIRDHLGRDEGFDEENPRYWVAEFEENPDTEEVVCVLRDGGASGRGKDEEEAFKAAVKVKRFTR